MIWESHPWRAELLELADRLEALTTHGDWSDSGAFRLERDLMVGTYSIRKLMEAKKLATSLENERFRVAAYPSTGECPDHLNWHHLDRFYDFEKPVTLELSLGALCNQFVHSWIWTPTTDGEAENAGWEAILVSSDKDRMKRLHEFSAPLLIDLFRRVGNEDIASVWMTRDANGGWVRRSQTQEEMEPGGVLREIPHGL